MRQTEPGTAAEDPGASPAANEGEGLWQKQRPYFIVRSAAARRPSVLGPVVDRLIQSRLDGLRQLPAAAGLAVEHLRAFAAILWQGTAVNASKNLSLSEGGGLVLVIDPGHGGFDPGAVAEAGPILRLIEMGQGGGQNGHCQPVLMGLGVQQNGLFAVG